MLYQYQGSQPQIHESVFLAPGCRVIGNVHIGQESSVWYNAVLRGDVAAIHIGQNTNIQDNATVHLDQGQNTHIGHSVTLGHGAILHGCTIEDSVLIGMGATVLNGAVVGKGSLVGAATLIPPGKTIPPGSLVLGNPGKVIRELTEQERMSIMSTAQHYTQLARNYKENNSSKK